MSAQATPYLTTGISTSTDTITGPCTLGVHPRTGGCIGSRPPRGFYSKVTSLSGADAIGPKVGD